MSIPEQTQPDVPQVTQDALSDNAVMVDVREPHEWALGHAPDAVHIPLGEVESRMAELPQERPVVVICRSGARSSRVVRHLLDSGVDAVNMTGGMLAWQEAGRPMRHDGPGMPVVR